MHDYKNMARLLILALLIWVSQAQTGVAQTATGTVQGTVTDPSGGVVPFEAERTANGQRIVYVPVVPGAYKVHATYGCMDVPGRPRL